MNKMQGRARRVRNIHKDLKRVVLSREEREQKRVQDEQKRVEKWGKFSLSRVLQVLRWKREWRINAPRKTKGAFGSVRPNAIPLGYDFSWGENK